MVTTTFMNKAEFDKLARAKSTGEQGVTVWRRADMPTLPDTVELDVFYAEESIMGTVGSLFNLTHSGLILHAKSSSPGVPSAMTFQYFGVTFGTDVILPKIKPNAMGGKDLEWRNNSMICYSPVDLPKGRWGAVKQHIGTCSGKAFNQWCEWVAGYADRNPGYQMWDVWDHYDAAIANRFLSASKCDDFIDSAMREMYRCGAKLDTQETLYKNTVPFLTKQRPQPMDMSKPDDAREVCAFYEHLYTLGASLAGGDGGSAPPPPHLAPAKGQTTPPANRGAMSLPALLRTIASSLDVFIVYERSSNKYYRVLLTPPYICNR